MRCLPRDIDSEPVYSALGSRKVESRLSHPRDKEWISNRLATALQVVLRVPYDLSLSSHMKVLHIARDCLRAMLDVTPRPKREMCAILKRQRSGATDAGTRLRWPRVQCSRGSASTRGKARCTFEEQKDFKDIQLGMTSCGEAVHDV